MKILLTVLTYLHIVSSTICLAVMNRTDVSIDTTKFTTAPTPIESSINIEETHSEKPVNMLSSIERITIRMQKEMEELDSITDKKEWFQAYKKIIFKYKKWFDMPETVFDVYTADEVNLICRVVETECYDQSFDAKCNVASVIFNRVEDGRFGEDIEEVITRPRQFVYGRKELTEDTILAVQYAYEIEDTTNGALYFHSGKKRETFNKAKYIFTDDAGHNFYGP